MLRSSQDLNLGLSNVDALTSWATRILRQRLRNLATMQNQQQGREG